MCDPGWRVIHVHADGWDVIKNPGLKFIRHPGMEALPIPEPGGKLSELGNFVNATGPDLLLVTAFLIMSFHPTGPYPVLLLHGEQGSCKSTCARVLRELVDPNSAPLRSRPRTDRELAISADHSWLISFDNLSTVSDWFSDLSLIHI